MASASYHVIEELRIYLPHGPEICQSLQMIRQGFKDFFHVFILAALVFFVGCLAIHFHLGQLYAKVGSVAVGTEEDLHQAFKDNATWFVNNQRYDGSFTYLRRPKTFRVARHGGILRQMAASQGLANARALIQTPALDQAHLKNLKYLKNLIRHEEDRAFIQGPKDSEAYLQNTLFAVLTLLDSPYHARFSEDLEAMSRFIGEMQNADGSFRLISPSENEVSPKTLEQLRRHEYPAGQAIFACAALYEALGNEEDLACARKAFRFYTDHIIGELATPAFDSWQAIGVARLYAVDPKLEYLVALQPMVERIYEKLQIIRTANSPEEVPFAYNHALQAVYGEALGYASRAFKAADPGLSIKYADENKKTREFIYAKQIPLSVRIPFLVYTKHVAGAIPLRDGDDLLRVDTMAHALNLMAEALTRSLA